MAVNIYFPNGTKYAVVSATSAEPGMMIIPVETNSGTEKKQVEAIICRQSERIVAQFRLDMIAGYDIE